MILRRVFQCALMLLACELLLSTCVGQWQPHDVRFLASPQDTRQIPGQLQIVTESWNRVVAVPYLIYMPEKDRLLLLVGCDYPHRANVLWSDDRGQTWTEPKPLHVTQKGKPEVGMGTSLAYLGKGKVMFYVGLNGVFSRWFSRDYGQTWDESVAVAKTPDDKPWYTWDPPLVERDAKTGKVTQLLETAYTWHGPISAAGSYQQGYIRFSSDEGKTWKDGTKVPQWKDVSEVALLRAPNGDLLGACRTDMPKRFVGDIDHYEGLAISTSKDNGRTWSELNRLYEWGRHHASMLVMPDGRIVMTYVVRKGYTDTADGRNRFSIEAIISNDNGKTWDLDHRYILHSWDSDKKLIWWPSSQCTSSVLLPDGSIMTAFGTGYRCKAGKKPHTPTPRDAGIVHWRPVGKPKSFGGPITSATLESDLRNVFVP